MALDIITITQDNASWAIRENFRRIYEELEYKVPNIGTVKLEGNWDFQNLYSIFNVTGSSEGTSAYSESVIDPA